MNFELSSDMIRFVILFRQMKGPKYAGDICLRKSLEALRACRAKHIMGNDSLSNKWYWEN